MHVQIKKIDNPTIISNLNGIQETQFDITFSAPLCHDLDAHLRVIHASSKINVRSIESAISDHLIDITMSVCNIYDFKRVDGEGVESINQSDADKHFYFEGRILEFLSAGQGFVFKVGKYEIVLDLRVIPEDFLDEDLDPGKWICFKTDRLYLWTPFQ
jgi:hypothetical protein